MTTRRAPFMPVTPDIDDEQLERLAQGKGVGTLVTTKPAEPRAGEGAPVPSPAAASMPTKIEKPEAAVPTPTPRADMKSVNLELPLYLWTDLKIRAAQSQTSLRHVIMKALKAEGFTIADIDMIEDGRRLRN